MCIELIHYLNYHPIVAAKWLLWSAFCSLARCWYCVRSLLGVTKMYISRLEYLSTPPTLSNTLWTWAILVILFGNIASREFFWHSIRTQTRVFLIKFRWHCINSNDWAGTWHIWGIWALPALPVKNKKNNHTVSCHQPSNSEQWRMQGVYLLKICYLCPSYHHDDWILYRIDELEQLLKNAVQAFNSTCNVYEEGKVKISYLQTLIISVKQQYWINIPSYQ